jgi:hypothetical protein
MSTDILDVKERDVRNIGKSVKPVTMDLVLFVPNARNILLVALMASAS